MKILKVEPKDVYVDIEISLEDLKGVKIGMEAIDLRYNGDEEPEKANAAKATNEFYDMISHLIKDLDKEV